MSACHQIGPLPAIVRAASRGRVNLAALIAQSSTEVATDEAAAASNQDLEVAPARALQGGFGDAATAMSTGRTRRVRPAARSSVSHDHGRRLRRDDPRAGLLDELDGGGHIVGSRHRVGHRLDLVAQVDRDDVGALRRQLDRVGTALTARRTRDESDLCPSSAPISRATGPWRGRLRRSAPAS